jgi:hypothetical protein
MANPTSNFNWQMPTASDLVTDLPADFEVFGQAVDTALMDLKGGTTGQVLAKASNTNMDFTWVAQDDSNAIQNAIVDAKGDLIGASGADTPARLAVGTNGQVLTADSTAATGLAWATPAIYGGMTLLSTTTLSGASTTISSIDGSYTNLVAFIHGVTPAANVSTFICNPNNASNITDFIRITETTSWALDANQSLPLHANGLRTTGVNAMTLTIFNYASAANKPFLVTGQASTTGDDRRAVAVSGGIRTSSAITSLVFTMSASTFSAGTVLLYGVK